MISKQFKQASHDVNMRNPCPETTTLRHQSLSTEVDADKISLILKKWWNFPVGLCCRDCEEPRRVSTISVPVLASILQMVNFIVAIHLHIHECLRPFIVGRDQ